MGRNLIKGRAFKQRLAKCLVTFVTLSAHVTSVTSNETLFGEIKRQTNAEAQTDIAERKADIALRLAKQAMTLSIGADRWQECRLVFLGRRARGV
jgi:hypothetical protein